MAVSEASPSKVMKRKSYPIGFQSIRLKLILVLLVCFVAIAFFVGAVWLGEVLTMVKNPDVEFWIIIAFLIGGMILTIIGSMILREKMYARMPCPKCGRKNLEQTTSRDSEELNLLICKNCAVEWNLGISDKTN